VNRRKFVTLSAAAAANAALAQTARAQSNATVHIEEPVAAAKLMPVDFTGLSYETGQLYNAEFFSPQNTALIATFRDLSNQGVLRLGGHLSNITPWEGVGQDDPKQIRGVRHGIEDYWEWPLVDPIVQHNKKGMITRQAIKNLKGFLDAVNWRLIYGLNFACGSAARGADEAAFVANTIGDRLIAFVVGNEADGFGEDPFFRDKGYNFDQYIAEYETWVKTIRAKTPHAPFAGPDTEGHVDTWVKKFGERTRGDAVMLTSHFYAMGPASDPAMTAERLLQKVNPLLEQQIAEVKSAVAASGGTPYRMDEGNSCFGGGKDGVSNAYASALWVADYMLHVACAGFIGVNLHGGGTGFYAPIESSDKSPAGPRPVYYGMQFAQQLAGYELAPCAMKTGENVTAYLATKREQTQLAVINKGANPIHITLPKRLVPKPMTQRWVLNGPALSAKEGVRLTKEPAAATTPLNEVPGYSAVLLQTA
jgi:Glycosyl hydrolase family 79, N-terminal domain